ncbi:MAG TPA: pyridoxal phosphate-dependent aminotransferase, partial [Candidatus Acidoferrum sp.]|nr:pyridoxal phosphate-dependent aminotransferase [Candidatus Acidoferrum sp.]
MLATHDDRIASAVQRLGSENAFEVLARARQLEAQGRRVVHMEIGEPDFDTPEHIKKAAVEALYDSHTHYTPSAGIPALRATIAEYASRFRHISPVYTTENVIVGPGAKPVIWNVLSALLNPGDDFIYFDPAYPAYASCSSYLQANVHAIPLRESRNWRMDLDEMESRVSDKTKAVVINSPHNPTGGVLTRGDLERIAEMAQRHDFIVIADEIYSRNFYLDSEYLSIASLDGMRERTIIVDGFSKAYAMTGWRLGYCIAPPQVAKAATLMANNTYACTSTFIQKAGIAALLGPDESVIEMRDIFHKRRDMVIAGLNAIPNVTACMPPGAFYAFPNISKVTPDDKRLASYLLEEAGVALLGGSCFGDAGAGCL